MMELYPLKLSPSPSPRLWGGHKLQEFVPGFDHYSFADPIGEAWLVYAENKVVNGTLQGKTLQELANQYGKTLLGTKSVARYGTTVPLLAKFIDAGEKLSIQVHPDDTYALSKEANSGYLGKTEAWYIIEAEPDASIIWGFNQQLSKDQIWEAVKAGELERYLNVVPVKAGDVIYNAPGTVHAIGAGIFLFEIQQSSDLTYRLYDFNRKDAAGNLRDLHVEKALDVADLMVGENAKVQVNTKNPNELVRCEFFVAEKYSLSSQPQTFKTQKDSLELLTVLSGQLKLEYTAGSLSLSQADSVVLPASLGTYTLSGEAHLIRSYIP